MKYTLYKEFPDHMKKDWDALVSRSVSDVPFLLYEFMKSWWQTRGGGEWPQAELAIITAMEEDTLVGIAPMFYVPEHQGKRCLFLLGTIEVYDYLDLIVEAKDLSAFVDGLLTFIDSDALPEWDILDFSNLLDDSLSLQVLQQIAEQRSLSYQEEVLQPSPYIPLPGDWDAYLAGIKKKQRHEIRRKMRRMENSEVESNWYVVKDKADLETEMDEFLDMMMQDRDKEAFMTAEMRDHMQLTARSAFDAGILHLSFLVVDGKRAAGKFMFAYNDVLWAYNSCVNFSMTEYSPGWVLLGYLLEWANQNGFKEFDFMRGDEQYKYRFGAVDRFVKRFRIER
ncbi:MAG: GNAT family N-acetyltransferase [Anaerolineaceae bacterium]|nr:GNAT family N-acetyltransferase [Anaerolineaceae bacterium]